MPLSHLSVQATAVTLCCTAVPDASHTGLSREAASVGTTRRRGYGFGDLHSDREQWLDDVSELAAVYAVVSTQPYHCGEGRDLWLQLPLVDGEAAGLWWTHRVLGSQSGVLHPDGGAGRRHRAYTTVRVGGAAHPAASPGGTDGLDHRRHLQRTVRY